MTAVEMYLVGLNLVLVGFVVILFRATKNAMRTVSRASKLAKYTIEFSKTLSPKSTDELAEEFAKFVIREQEKEDA